MGLLDHFLTEVTDLAAHVRSCPTVEGASEILLPGDPELRTLTHRSVHGIPLDEGNWKQLADLAGGLGVPLLS
jgi:LDH2 family malate/lactate/ureidoglycolate dehydrogenase